MTPMRWVASMAAVLLLAGCSDDDASGETAELAKASDESSATATATAGEGATDEGATGKGAEDDADDAPVKAKVGEAAPGFTLSDQDGNEHTLSDYRGRIVVLEWVNPNCPYVQRHYESGTMTSLVEQFSGEDVTWLAIDSTRTVEPKDSKKWRKEHGLTYPILQDAESEVARKYEARTTPHMFVVDAEGTLQYAGGIDDDPRGRKDDPTNHVKGAVQALLKGEDPPVRQAKPYGCTIKYTG